MSFEDDLNHAIKQIENQRYNAAEQAMLSRMVDAQCQRLRQIWAMQTIGQHQRKPLADDSEPHILAADTKTAQTPQIDRRDDVATPAYKASEHGRTTLRTPADPPHSNQPGPALHTTTAATSLRLTTADADMTSAPKPLLHMAQTQTAHT